MHKKLLLVFLVFILWETGILAQNTKSISPLVLAHRGASAYLPEHTLPAVALAHGQGADFIEQDVILSRDGQAVVLHDLTLDATTDVKDVFPGRNRANGQFYVIDFTLEELKKLRVHERSNRAGTRSKYPARFPLKSALFQIVTLQEEIELIQGLNRSTGRNAGLFVEIKDPEWHHAEGKDLAAEVLKVLGKYGYKSAEDKIYVQSFSANELKRLRSEFKTKLKLVQLIGENSWRISKTDFTKLTSKDGLTEVAVYADGIGPWIKQVVTGVGFSGKPELTPLVKDAHSLGLVVFPYTLRADALPGFADTFEELLEIIFKHADVDGVFTDFPDLVITFLKNRN